MTLDSSLSRIRYVCNGATTVFSVPFKVWNASELSVSFENTLGAITDITSQCVISVGEDSASVSYTIDGSPAPSGCAIAIIRNMPFVQPDDYISGTRFDPAVIEDAQDRACAERQQLKEKIDRAITIPATSTETADELIASIYSARDTAVSKALEASSSSSTASGYATNAQTYASNASSSAEAASSSATSAQASAESASSVAETAVSEHNTSASAHSSLFADKASTSQLSGKASTSLDNLSSAGIAYIQSLSGAHSVCEVWQSGTEWYRKYADGWIEQGGRVASISGGDYTVTLHQPFSDTNYTVCPIFYEGGAGSKEYNNVQVSSYTTTTFTARFGCGESKNMRWYAFGQGVLI